MRTVLTASSPPRAQVRKIATLMLFSRAVGLPNRPRVRSEPAAADRRNAGARTLDPESRTVNPHQRGWTPLLRTPRCSPVVIEDWRRIEPHLRRGERVLWAG